MVDDGARPTADFAWNPENIVAGEEITFIDKSISVEGSEII